MLCINQKCEDCKTLYNAEFFSSLKCTDSCFKNDANCTDHKVKCLQYERAPYDHRGVTKKKIHLVDKFVTLPELIELLKICLKISLGTVSVQVIQKHYGTKFMLI